MIRKLLQDAPMDAAVAVFGSALRGDMDRDSDVDVLVVSSNVAYLNAVEAVCAKTIISPATFTWKRLQQMACRGTLFIEHLARESRPVVDPDDMLAQLLVTRNRRVCFEWEARTARQLFAALETVPATASGHGWASDMTMVAYRCLAIATLANQGEFVFSFGMLARRLVELGCLDRGAIPALAATRICKVLYRKGSVLQGGQAYAWQRALHHLRRAFDLDVAGQIVDLDTFAASAARRAVAGCHDLGYVRQRLAEAILIHAPVPDWRSQISAIRDGIARPRAYTWHFSANAVPHQERLSRLFASVTLDRCPIGVQRNLDCLSAAK